MKYIPTLLIVALVVGGFAYYTLFAGPNRALLEQVSQPDEVTVSKEDEVKTIEWEPRSGTASLKELQSWGDNIECTISFETDDFVYSDGRMQSIEGTYFVGGGKIRGDFLTQAPDLSGQILTSMIIDGSQMYLWSEIEGGQYGMKMDLSDADQTPVDTNEPISLDEAVTYNCKQWKEVDNTIFLPPSNILFNDMNELLQTGMEYGTIYEEAE